MLFRSVIAVLPWAALLAAIAARGLWWTQRAPALRFFVEYAAVNWAVLWLFVAGEQGSRGGGKQDLASQLPSFPAFFSLLLLALGVEGSAFGLNPFGCGVSMAIATIGVILLAIGASGRRSTILASLTAGVATLIALGLAEGAVRLLHVADRVQDVDSREYARQFYSLTPPGTAFLNRSKPIDEFPPALIEINRRGIRGPERADDMADVLVIGDSFVEARQLPWEVTVGPRLEAALRARSRSDRVVSHGMRGWSPLLEWNWYLKEGRRWHARTVFLFFFWNDLWPSGTEAATFRAVLTSDGRPVSFDVPVDPNWVWYKHVRLIRLTDAIARQVNVRDLRRAFTGGARALTSGPLPESDAQAMAKGLAAGPALTPGEPSALLDRPIPEFALPAVADASVPGLAASDIRGRVTLVNVFASWCVPCRAEHPILMRLSRDFAQQKDGPVLYGISYKDKAEDSTRFLRELGNPYAAIGHDESGRVGIEWGVYGVPETFLIDRSGRIRHKHVGPISPKDLQETLLPLIAELKR